MITDTAFALPELLCEKMSEQQHVFTVSTSEATFYLQVVLMRVSLLEMLNEIAE